MNAFLKDNVVIGLSATTFNGSEMDGYIQICAEVIFGVLMKNITVSFMPLETGEGECHALFRASHNKASIFLRCNKKIMS